MNKNIFIVTILGVVVTFFITTSIKQNNYNISDNNNLTFESLKVNQQNDTVNEISDNEISSSNIEESDNKISNPTIQKSTDFIENTEVLSNDTSLSEEIIDENKLDITNSTNNTNEQIITETEEIVKNKKIIDKSLNLQLSKTTNIILVDKSNGDVCAQVIDVFYSDNNYDYYFTCLKSPNMYVIKNGKEYKLKQALENGIVTISELESIGYTFPKKSKNTYIK